MTLYLGLMSGTSMDGIDVALLEAETVKFIAGRTYPYSLVLKTKLMDLIAQFRLHHESVESPRRRPRGPLHAYVNLTDFFHCHRWVGEAFAAAALQFLNDEKLDAANIHAIGSHGQTVWHAPDAEPGFTIQLGCGHTLAVLTNKTVVADFRTRDMICGGQGAPLAPLFHQVLFEKEEKPLSILNIGGISNLSYLATADRMIGFDVGPGNALLDAWALRHLTTPFDSEGSWAASGQVIPDLLYACLDDPYFLAPPPKSLDKDYFSLEWLEKRLNAAYAARDVQATLVAFSAHAIKRALNSFPTKKLLICGGGVHNRTLMQQLSACLPGISVTPTEARSGHPDYIEAMMCAWLASQTLQHKPVDLSQVTGGKKTILGCVYSVASHATEEHHATR